jgi:hypothetical protein
MNLDHPLISCDDHLDLNQLPADLWTARLPEHLREKGPRVEERDGKLEWVCNGKRWGSWSGGDKGSDAPKPVFTAFDRAGIKDLTARRPGRSGAAAGGHGSRRRLFARHFRPRDLD